MEEDLSRLNFEVKQLKKKVHVVGAVIENEAHHILCAQRSSTMSLANLWEFPGGKIEEGETPQQALIREIREELACEVSVFERVEDTTYEYENVIVRLETYHCKITSGTPIAQEHAQLIWLPQNEISRLQWAAADIPTVEKLAK